MLVYERHEDDSTEVLARDARNAKNRHSLRSHDAVPTGRSYRVPVECIDIDHEVQPGSRLGVAVAADNTDSVRRDPDGLGTHEVVLGAPDGDGGTSLRLPITGGLDSIEAGATTLPDVGMSRSDDGSAFYGGQTNQVDITLTEADTEAVVRDTIPFG